MEDRDRSPDTGVPAPLAGTGFVLAGGSPPTVSGEAPVRVRRRSERRLDVELPPSAPGDRSRTVVSIDLPTASVSRVPAGGEPAVAVRSESGAVAWLLPDAPPVDLEPGDTLLVETRPGAPGLALRYEPWGGSGTGALRERLRASPAEAVRARESFERFCAARGVPEPVAQDLALAVQEALDNVVEHGYRGVPRGLTLVEADVSAGRDVVVTVRDRGVGVDPRSAPAPDTTSSLDDRRVGGLGVHLVRSLVDEVRYERRGGENRLVIVKRLGTA